MAKAPKSAVKKSDLYKTIVREARKRIASMDKTDGGSVIETAGTLDLALRTVMTAIHCGINQNDWSVIGDAMVMLQQIEYRYRPADLKDSTVKNKEDDYYFIEQER